MPCLFRTVSRGQSCVRVFGLAVVGHLLSIQACTMGFSSEHGTIRERSQPNGGQEDGNYNLEAGLFVKGTIRSIHIVSKHTITGVDVVQDVKQESSFSPILTRIAEVSSK
jgi:hypothetical protein